MSKENIQIIILLISLIILSAYFSACETAFSSLKIIRLEEKLKNKKKSLSHHSIKLFNKFNETLSIILVSNNVVNITAATISILLFERLQFDNPFLISTIVTTMLILVFGEFIPKILAKKHPERFAYRLSYPLWVVFLLLKPLVKLIGLFTKNSQEPITTEQELIRTVSKIGSEGEIEKSESILINSALRFDDKYVKSVFTKWKNVLWISENSIVGDLIDLISKKRHTRIPVVRDEEVVGYISVTDVLGKKKSTSIKPFIRTIYFVSQNIHLDDALELIQRKRSHILIVTQKQSRTRPIGIVTLEDLIEEIIGEVYDETDTTPKVIPIGHNKFIIDGDINVSKAFIEMQGIVPYQKNLTFTKWAYSMLLENNQKFKKTTKFKYDKFIIKWLEKKNGSEIFQVIENE